MIPLSAEEGARWLKAAEPVFDLHIKELEGKGIKRSDTEAYLKYIRERSAYWAKQAKDRKIPTAD